MQVCVLGPLVIREDSAGVPAGGPIQRRILARLALDAGRPVSFDQLELAAWGDEPPLASRHTIATHVFRLRQLALDIATTGDRYVLRTPTDLEEVTRLAEASRAAERAGDRDGARRSLATAIELSRGRAFAELDDLPEAIIAAARVEELVEGLREDRLALTVDDGVSAEVIADARDLATAQPYRERRWELLMLALYRAGRQAEALDAYAECRRRLLDDLGLDPGASLRRMQQAVLAQDPALAPESVPEAAGAAVDRAGGSGGGADSDGTVRVRSAIPGTSTRLIGREVQLRDLGEAWDRARLVSIVGPPGAGKTRLALEFARGVTGRVWYVALEQIPASQAVAAAILEAVDPSSRAAEASAGVTRAVGTLPGLLILDGAEGRQGEVASEVATLIAACPELRILVTSRERLDLLDEALVPLGPLAEDDAIALLVDRARLVDPRFRLSVAETDPAVRLCGLVDRLPLGIELVARHLQLLRVDEVAARVESDMARWAGGPVAGRPGLWAA
ncbi:MAG TPA: BTAD domain-containing putative transcriptional regulator, partial [Candidatus Binatia bacterium]|nr:BTAD domain-containing putative transcriptional regulator [Candidatus Binatia bacterium]